MKNNKKNRLLMCLICIAICISLAGCEDDEKNDSPPTTYKEEKKEEIVKITDFGLADNVSEGSILHCWNWSYNNIKEHMEEIAQAGFSGIQTSPVQQPKDYTYEGVVYTTVGTPDGTGGSDGQWWKLYQPVSFNICDNGQTWLGSKQEFADMCAEAEKYNIKVIVDVVVNHMGNNTGWKNSMSDITPQVGTYCNKDMLSDETYWHINSYQCWMSDSRMHITQGTIGMPDLNTADERVQNMVLDLLKECVDAGADGFRFDAAKHIETPNDDAAFASDFWPNVINGIRAYSDHELFIYGEILNSPGENFDIKNYTEYMSVTDSSTGNNRRNDIRYNNASSAANISYTYESNKCVVWNESHDTYVGDGSSYLADDTMIKQTWAILAARGKATPLYLARPYYSNQILQENGNKKNLSNLVQTEMGEVGTMTWSDPSVAAVNNFRNDFIGEIERVSCQNKIVYIERGTTGVVIVNLAGSGEVKLKAKKMVDGVYTDRISGNTFTVVDGYIQGNIENEDGIAVVYDVVAVPYAEVSVPGGTISTKSIETTITIKNAQKAVYIVDDGTPVEFEEGVSIVLGEELVDGESTKLVVKVYDDDNTEYVYKHIYNKKNSVDNK